MVEKVIAILVLAACAVLLARLLAGPARRRRFDAALLRIWERWRGSATNALRRPAVRRDAARAADAAIRRAREGVRRDGNVIRPPGFRRPRKPH